MKGSITTGAKLRTMIFAALMLSGMQPAMAWDGYVTGTVVALEITGGNNFAFRVHLAGATNICGNGMTWGYLNETDSNYKVYVAGILAAKAQGTAVSLYLTLENGYCHIGHIALG
jgi:hypothetical protein